MVEIAADARGRIARMQKRRKRQVQKANRKSASEDERALRRLEKVSAKMSHPIYKNINRAIIYAPGSSHAYI
jgi:hypothetical protein